MKGPTSPSRDLTVWSLATNFQICHFTCYLITFQNVESYKTLVRFTYVQLMAFKSSYLLKLKNNKNGKIAIMQKYIRLIDF